MVASQTEYVEDYNQSEPLIGELVLTESNETICSSNNSTNIKPNNCKINGDNTNDTTAKIGPQLSVILKRTQLGTDPNFKHQIKWFNVLTMSMWHVGSLYALRLVLTGQVRWLTITFAYVLYLVSGLGITAGAHRLWSHRAYKARLPLRILLMVFNTIAFQNDIHVWARDHRAHHKFSETDADPHNAKRGFFFSHVGWLLCRKHPLVAKKGQLIDTSDLLVDPVVFWQKQYYFPLVGLLCFLMPTVIPHWLWHESKWNAFWVCAILRYCAHLNATWCINSFAHLWGRRPYDKSINPAENKFVSLVTTGEGFHNFHHTFPYDYAASELGFKLNLSKVFIDLMTNIGWAYDLRVVDPKLVLTRKNRTGDCSELGAYDREHN